MLAGELVAWYRRLDKKGVPRAESSRSVRGLEKGVCGKPYPWYRRLDPVKNLDQLYGNFPTQI